MNSIDNVLARIQEIINRIHEIQATQGRAAGLGPNGAVQPQAAAGGIGASASTQTGGGVPASKAVTGANNPEFQKLLESALANQGGALGGTAGSSGTLLSGVGDLGNLGSALGTDLGVSASAGSSNALAQYRKELLQAIQDLAARKNQVSNPPQ